MKPLFVIERKYNTTVLPEEITDRLKTYLMGDLRAKLRGNPQQPTVIKGEVAGDSFVVSIRSFTSGARQPGMHPLLHGTVVQRGPQTILTAQVRMKPAGLIVQAVIWLVLLGIIAAGIIERNVVPAVLAGVLLGLSVLSMQRLFSRYSTLYFSFLEKYVLNSDYNIIF